MFKNFKFKKALIGRIPHGEDLLGYIENFCVENKITNAWLTGIGGVNKLCFGYFDKEKKAYIEKEFDEFMEIVNLTGNISLKDGKPFPHLHISCADKEGKVFGGHLMPKTEVFATEIIIQEFEGEKDLERTHDKKTGLMLWSTEIKY